MLKTNETFQRHPTKIVGNQSKYKDKEKYILLLPHKVNNLTKKATILKSLCLIFLNLNSKFVPTLKAQIVTQGKVVNSSCQKSRFKNWF